ncbi:MAG TPA: N-terminal phage integrase SAM-like domain-containing protein [Thermomicrobiales bacterium]|nr:N-terminal phage integrase SAM-like domain-containing protein [Thermomicrobiales bacterium]
MAGKRGNGEGTVRQRKPGLWEGRYTYHDATGKLQRRSVYGATQKEATEKLRAALRAIDQGDTPIIDRQTVAQFLAGWLANNARPAVRPKTYDSYAQVIRLYIAPTIGELRLARLQPQHVQAMLNGMR